MDSSWPRPWDQPSAARLPLDYPGRDAILVAHADALADGDDGYADPTTGLFVFTSRALAERACCEQGCRHCPYIE